MIDPETITTIKPRETWYEMGDVIFSLIDEGTKQKTDVRLAQIAVAELELASALTLSTGVDETGHKWEVGPYIWSVRLFGANDVHQDPDEDDDLVIGESGGGDSAGFGYNWMWDKETNEVYMTEDRLARIKVG